MRAERLLKGYDPGHRFAVCIGFSEVWYSSPANRHLYFKAFKEQYLATGKADFSAFLSTHPETISQTFGDEATSEGQMVKAMVWPSAVLMAIGTLARCGIMMRAGGNSMWGWLFHAFRGLMTPFGLLMVLQTPVVSGAGAGNKRFSTRAMARWLCVALQLAVVTGDILLADFDGEASHQWKQMNDPVMGGRSTGSFSVVGGLGVFEGEVVDVPFLHAPGFIKASVADMNPFGRIFPDISSCKNIELTVKSDTAYKGYRFSIGDAHAPGGKFHAYGYKADFDAGKVGEFNTVTLPLKSFTDYWDDATGAAIKTCQENKIYCPDAKTLQDMRTMGVWAEGVAGKVRLEIKSVRATGCADVEYVIM
ncbi:unnamed protein product [Effrenium voratum]|uniref:NADH:ubiquinone oxidoreductase intermediate-associated protein 30 domain-containing protein n=1 Tax=Effrenium voratum TaxID=2562239 RepID=A0AA36HVD9_9DINO|nr:unnamed protein product [Effrenium voratum]